MEGVYLENPDVNGQVCTVDLAGHGRKVMKTSRNFNFTLNNTCLINIFEH